MSSPAIQSPSQSLQRVWDYLTSNLPPSASLGDRSQSQKSLARLTDDQVFYLASDVNEEMLRRKMQTSASSLPTSSDLSDLRNIGRQKMASLPLYQFEKMCYDICQEISQRGLISTHSSTDEGNDVTEKDYSDTPPAHFVLVNGPASESEASGNDTDYHRAQLFRPRTLLTHSGASEYIVADNPHAIRVCSMLMNIFENRSRYKVFIGYRDQEAQAILNLLQALLDYPKIERKVQRELVVAIQRLSERSALIPESFTLRGVEMEGEYAASSGRFGEVWKGRFQDQRVSLKIVRAYRDSQMHQLLKAFSREAVLWGQLSHSNLLPFYGIYRLEDTHRRICLVSPWMEHGNVNDFLEKEPDFPRIYLISDIAAGIAYLHDKNVVHGDLKGANILVNASLSACVADFGLSTIRDPDVVHLSTSSAGHGGGTIRWMAPELLDPNDEIHNSMASDIYAYACVCYEIYTGHVPFFEIRRDQTVMFKIASGERPSRPPANDPAFQGKGMTRDLWELMEDCWVSDPRERPTTQDIVHRLPRKPRRRKMAGTAGVLVSPSSFRASVRGDLDSHLSDPRVLRLLDIDTSSLLLGN